jgi:hypothetical protein
MKPTHLAGLVSLVLFFGVAIERASPVAEEADKDLTRLLKAKSLRCTFTTGVVAFFESTRPQVEQFVTDTRPRPGPGGTVVKATDPVYLDSIDYPAQKARLIAGLGAGAVTAFTTPAGVYFVERPPLGGVNLYFVFGRAVDGEFSAVSTMHTLIPKFNEDGQKLRMLPATEQSHGTCKVWQ